MKRWLALVVCGLVAGVFPGVAEVQNTTRPADGGALSADTRQKLMESLGRGAAYLRQQQHADGTWENHPGITAHGRRRRCSGSRARRRPRSCRRSARRSTTSRSSPSRTAASTRRTSRTTSPRCRSWRSSPADAPQDKPLIEKGRQYLADHLLDEGEGVTPSDKFYGGMGYGGTSDGGRADIISLEYGLRAMKEADLAANDAAWEKAIKFLQRTQNNSETNDQRWATNDGGFIYYPGYSQAGDTRSYGSATYAGHHELHLGEREEGRPARPGGA